MKEPSRALRSRSFCFGSELYVKTPRVAVGVQRCCQIVVISFSVLVTPRVSLGSFTLIGVLWYSILMFILFYFSFFLLPGVLRNAMKSGLLLLG